MKSKLSGMPCVAALVAVLLAAGLAPQASGGDDRPIQEIMNQVNTRNRAMGKALRSPTALEAAGRKRMAADALAMIRLGNEARTLTEPSQRRKKPRQEWTRAVDALLQASEDFGRVIALEGSSRAQATRSYQKLQKTCINCHSAFREEAD